jgi:hypothetical protein
MTDTLSGDGTFDLALIETLKELGWASKPSIPCSEGSFLPEPSLQGHHTL